MSEATVVLKWRVPVDGNWHPVGSGPVALVDVQHIPGGDPRPNVVGVVTVWTIEPASPPAAVGSAVVVGTGMPVPERVEHLGSCQDSSLVWHVFRSLVTAAPESPAS